MQKLHVVCFRLILLMQGSYSGMNWISPVWIQTFLVYLGLKSGLYFCLKGQFEFRPFLVYLGRAFSSFWQALCHGNPGGP